MKIPAQHNTTHPPGQHCSEPVGKLIEEYQREAEAERLSTNKLKQAYDRGFQDGVASMSARYDYYNLGSEAER